MNNNKYDSTKLSRGYDVTVEEVIEQLKTLPPKAKFNCCGSSSIFIHVTNDKSIVNLDTDNLSEEYEEFPDYYDILELKFSSKVKNINISIDDKNNIYINNNSHLFANKIDKESIEDDINKKILLALANEMNYEPIFLFEEIVNRLNEILEETDDEN